MFEWFEKKLCSQWMAKPSSKRIATFPLPHGITVSVISGWAAIWLKKPAEQKHIAGVTGSHSDWSTDWALNGARIGACMCRQTCDGAPPTPPTDYGCAAIAKKLEQQKFREVCPFPLYFSLNVRAGELSDPLTRYLCTYIVDLCELSSAVTVSPSRPQISFECLDILQPQFAEQA